MSEQRIRMILTGAGMHDAIVEYHFESVPQMMVFKDRVDALYKDKEPDEHDDDCDCDECVAERAEANFEGRREAYG